MGVPPREGGGETCKRRVLRVEIVLLGKGERQYNVDLIILNQFFFFLKKTGSLDNTSPKISLVRPS